ncbi:hypothetical protein [Flavobacterium lindanitolerans]|uniref:hypothetical protein n=1 Tax=Flavobacterium lindanitolerans TaxID=428988 RepID=UPI0023F39EAF|nr:hypothetical protein [Flavobacterium lindanitolerans]
MYLNALFITALILSTLFLLLFFRAFTWQQLKQLWLISRLNVITGKKNREKARKLEEQGLRKFTFSNGRIVVYAKTQARALYEKNEIVRNQKRKRNAILRKGQKQN